MKKFIKSPLGIGMTTTLFGFILSVLYDMFKGKQILSTIVCIFNWIWNTILWFLNINLKVWWVLVGVIASIGILWIIYRIGSALNSEPSFTKYKSDTIQGWKWEWHWQKNYYGKYEIEGLHPVCNSCGTALASKHDYHNNLYCVRCGKVYNGVNLPNENHIKIYIGDTVNRNLIPVEKNDD